MTSDSPYESSVLLARLRHIEAENASMKAESEQLKHRVTELSEQLEDANNEISRLCMVLKHREVDVQQSRRIRRLNELMLATVGASH